MLPVFSVIHEHRKDGRNSSDSKPKHVHLYSFEPYQLLLIIKHTFRRAQMLNRSKEIEITYFADFKCIHKQRKYSTLR